MTSCILQKPVDNRQITSFYKKALLSFCLIIMAIPPSFAQSARDTLKTDTIVLKNELSEIVISAYEQNKKITGLPAALFYLSPLSLNRFDHTTLVAAMNTIPGVRMEQRSPQSYRLDIRGSALRSPFGVRNVKIYYNGIPLTDPGGNTYLNQLSFNDIHALTVIKGPAGSLYGAGTGGVVLINSDLFSADSIQNGAEASYETGSYGMQQLTAKLRWGNNKYDQEIRYSDLKSSGYRDHTAMRGQSLAYEAIIKGSHQRKLSLTAHYMDLFYQLPGALTAEEYKKDPRASRPASGSNPSSKENHAAIYQKNFLMGANYSYPFNDHWKSTLILYGAYTDIENPTIRNYEYRKEPHFGGRLVLSHDQWFKQTHATFWIGGEWQQGFFNVTDHENISGNAGFMMVDNNVNNNTSLLFAQADLLFSKGWEITAAASLHHASVRFTNLFPGPAKTLSATFDRAISPRLSIAKKSGGIIFYADISSGYSPPTVSELLPSTSVINTNLHAEQGISYELGSRGTLLNEKLYYDLDVFIFNLSKSIALRRDSSGADYFVNAGGARQHGVEGYLSYSLADRKKLKLKTWISSSWFHFKYKNYQVTGNDYSGNNLPGVPPFTFVAGLDFKIHSAFSAHFTYTYNHKVPLNDANTVYASPYDLLNARIGYEKKFFKTFNLNLFGGINNVLNETYSLGNDINGFGGRFFNAAPGTNFYLGLIISYLYDR